MQVSVRDNNVDQALRALKKKLQREGVFREMKLKQHFEKPPSAKRARKQKRSAVSVSWRARSSSAKVCSKHPFDVTTKNPRLSNQAGVFLCGITQPVQDRTIGAVIPRAIAHQCFQRIAHILKVRDLRLNPRQMFLRNLADIRAGASGVFPKGEQVAAVVDGEPERAGAARNVSLWRSVCANAR